MKNINFETWVIGSHGCVEKRPSGPQSCTLERLQPQGSPTWRNSIICKIAGSFSIEFYWESSSPRATPAHPNTTPMRSAATPPARAPSLTQRLHPRLLLPCLLLLLLLLPVALLAKSDGQGAACNDATASLCTYECPETTQAWMVPWATLDNATGRFAPCCPWGMDRVAPPTRNAAYRIHLRGVDGDIVNGLTFKPCEIVEISVVVDVPGMKYLGLLMYAENSQGDKVGFFPVPAEMAESGDASSPFHTCHEGSAVMHSNADMKHYTETFRWQAPTAGSGPLTLRVLVKHGITNGGAFYWPGTVSHSGNTAPVAITDDFVLSEVVSSSSSSSDDEDDDHRWFVSSKGETCDAACARLSGDGRGKCNAQAMIDLAAKDTAEAQYAPVNKFYVCRQPFLQRQNTSVHASGTCSASAATFTVDPDEGWCYWKKPAWELLPSGSYWNSQSKVLRAAPPSSGWPDCVPDRLSACSTASEQDGRLCACDNTDDVDAGKDGECPSPLLKSRNDARGNADGTGGSIHSDGDGDGDAGGDRIDEDSGGIITEDGKRGPTAGEPPVGSDGTIHQDDRNSGGSASIDDDGGNVVNPDISKVEVDAETAEKLDDLNITLDVRLMLKQDAVWIRMEGPQSVR